MSTMFRSPFGNGKSKSGKPKADADAPGKDAQNTIAAESSSKINRNLSISRSGRHKLKGKKRESVMKDDLYREPSAADGATGGCQQRTQSSYNRNSGGAGGSTSCWEAEHTNSLRLQQSRTISSRPTIV